MKKYLYFIESTPEFKGATKFRLTHKYLNKFLGLKWYEEPESKYVTINNTYQINVIIFFILSYP